MPGNFTFQFSNDALVGSRSARQRLTVFAAALAILIPDQAATPTVPEGGKWVFDPPQDEFSAESLLDLRSLNEKVAGQSGHVTLTPDGNDFLLGDGKPARFWAVNSSYYGKNLDRHAQFLAKRGVNMVRFHGNITSGQKLEAIDLEERDKLWRTVAAMRKAGIYVTFSPYWAGASQIGRASCRERV